MFQKEAISMRKTLLALAALGGFFAIAGTAAQAAPSTAPAHVVPAYQAQAHHSVTPVDYYWRHHHYHHRRWEHNRWHYYD
jgi:hypothetical protein